MTVALVLLAVVCVVLLVMWRRAEADADTYAAAACDANQRSREQELLIRHQVDLIDGYRAELDALSITPPAAVAALQPDTEPPVPAGWLDDLHQLPTTYDREYPR